MVKMWSVTLRKNYSLGNVLAERKIEVVADNPIDAIKKAKTLQRKKAKAFVDNGCYRFATSVELITIESTLKRGEVK